jgi:hypothetical protein
MGTLFECCAAQLQRGVYRVCHSLLRQCWLSLPPTCLLPVQDFLRYLARLAKWSPSCPAAELAKVLGPVLLAPQSCKLVADADSLTAAAIAVVRALIRCAFLAAGGCLSCPWPGPAVVRHARQPVACPEPHCANPLASLSDSLALGRPALHTA